MEEKRVLSLSGGTRPGIVLVVTRNNLNSIIYRPRMFGRDPEDEIKASWIEGVLSEVSEFLKFWPGEIIPARRDGEWEP